MVRSSELVVGSYLAMSGYIWAGLVKIYRKLGSVPQNDNKNNNKVSLRSANFGG